MVGSMNSVDVCIVGAGYAGLACGRIHWAGTETAIQWSGTIEGAILSGERAAEEIISLIKLKSLI